MVRAVERVPVQKLRRLPDAERIEDRLHERALAGACAADDQHIAAAREAERIKRLRLLLRIVDPAENGGIRPVGKLVQQRLKRDLAAEHRQPELSGRMDPGALRCLRDIGDAGVKLGDALRTGRAPRAPMRARAVQRKQLDLVQLQLLRLQLRLVFRAGISGLEQLEQLVVADLQIAAPDARQIGSLRPLEHFHAVLPVLHLQAELEARVAPDLVVDDAGGLLRGKDQVDAETPAHTGGADQLLDELRLLLFQLGKFIADDDQVRQRLRCRALPVELAVLVNVIDAELAEDLLPPLDLTFQRKQRALRLVDAGGGAFFLTAPGFGDIRNDAGDVRRAAEQIRHAAAFVVDQDKCDLVRVIVQHQGENERLDQLALAGAGRTGDKPVRAVLLFMDIQIYRLRAVADADLRADAFIRPVRFPLFEQIPAADVGQMVHFQKADLVRDLAVGDLVDPVAADLPGGLLGHGRSRGIKRHKIRFAAVLVHPERAGEAAIRLDEVFAFVRQKFHMPIGQQEKDVIAAAVGQIAVDGVVVKNFRVCAEHDIDRKRRLAALERVAGVPCAQYVEQIRQNSLIVCL